MSGHQSTIADPYGRLTQFFYDAADRLIRTVAPDSSEVNFSYDRNGNATVIAPPGKPDHDFQYSDIDLETLYIPPYAGDSARTTTRTYTLDKEPKSILRPDSLNITLTYGGPGSLEGQPKSITFDRGTTVNLYDTTKGLQIGVISAESDTVSYQYDGTLLKKLEWKGPNGVNSVKGTVSFGYNADLQISSEIVSTAASSPDTVLMTYDQDGLMTGAGVMKLAYDTNTGLLTSDTVGNVVTSYTYNGFGELASKETKFNSTMLLKLEFVRDSLGRITEKTEIDETDTTKNSYEYDAQGRLSKVWKNDTLAATYAYDGNGNRLAKITPTQTDSGTYDAQDRMLKYGDADYFYSEYGDLQMKVEGTDTTRYAYDAFGSLVSVTLPSGTLVEYLLDGNGLRVGRKVNGAITQKWVYSNNLRIVAETDSADNIVSRFVYTTSENVPEYIIKNDTLFRFAIDQVGSIRQIVEVESGLVVRDVDFDEFGNVQTDTSPGYVPIGFAGGVNDPLTGLVRFGGRDFLVVSGRWSSKDPMVFEGGAKNLFGYCANDPINGRDPSGEFLDVVVDILLAIADYSSFDIGQNAEDLAVDAVSVAASGPIGSIVKANATSLLRKIGLKIDRFKNLAKKSSGKKIFDKRWMGNSFDFGHGFWDGLKASFLPASGTEFAKEAPAINRSAASYASGFVAGATVGGFLSSILPLPK